VFAGEQARVLCVLRCHERVKGEEECLAFSLAPL
jgi:hypothetical protein